MGGWPGLLIVQILEVPRPSSAWAGMFIGHRSPPNAGADSWSALAAEALPAGAA